MAHHISPGQIILTGLIPYPNGKRIQYPTRPYLVIGITNTHVETLIISSIMGKAHKLAYKSNFELKNSIPPLAKASFVKLDSYQKTELTRLSDLKIASNGIKIDGKELSAVLSQYPKYLR